MNTLSPNQVTDIVLRALDAAAYVSADALEELNETSGDRYATIDFECGDGSGSLYLAATDGFLREIASGLHDVDKLQVDVDTEGVEALMELASILCDEVIDALGGGEVRAHHGEAVTMDPAHMPDGGELFAQFESREGMLEVAVETR